MAKVKKSTGIAIAAVLALAVAAGALIQMSSGGSSKGGTITYLTHSEAWTHADPNRNYTGQHIAWFGSYMHRTLTSYARAEGLSISILRPFSGYGSDQSLDYPFPSFIKRGKEKQAPFDVWGKGTQVRDFIHIEDVIRATFEAITNKIEISNLCSGRPTSFIDLAELVMMQAGYLAEIRTNPTAPVGVAYRVGDTRKMLSFYEPRISLEEGIDRAFKGI